MLDLAVRFLIGATVVGTALWISDNHTARVGGILSAIPKTSAVSLFVIAYEHGGTFAAETAVSSLFGIAAVIAYTTAFALLLERTGTQGSAPWLAFAGAVCLYALLVVPYLTVLDGALAIAVNLALILLVYLVSVLLRIRRSRAPTPPSSVSNGKAAHPRGSATLRYLVPALVAGTLVLAATLAADLLGPVWGGIASVFPANVTTAILAGAIVLDPGAAVEQARSVPDGVAAAGAFVLVLHLLLPITHPVVVGVAGYLAWGMAAWGLSGVRVDASLVGRR